MPAVSSQFVLASEWMPRAVDTSRAVHVASTNTGNDDDDANADAQHEIVGLQLAVDPVREIIKVEPNRAPMMMVMHPQQPQRHCY